MQCLSPSQLLAAVSGFNYFGLIEAAHVFQQQPDDTEATEERLNKMYWAAVPSDQTLVHAFRVKLLAAPDAFAPVGESAHA